MSPNQLKAYLNKFGLKVPKNLDMNFVENELRPQLNKVQSKKVTGERHKKAGCGLRNLNTPNHWIPNIHKENFSIERPIIMCFPGNGAISPQKANGFCKTIERVLGLNHEADTKNSSYDFVDIMGVYYGTDSKDDTSGTLNKEEQEYFIDRFLMPLCTDSSGELLPLKKICLNMSRLTFCTHCYGALALDEIMCKFTNRLENMGLTKDEIINIKSHCCQITYSAYINASPVPTIRIDSLTDSFHKGMDKEYKDTYGHMLDGIEIQYDTRGMFRNKPNRYPNAFEILHIYTSRLLNIDSNKNIKKIIDEHTIEYLSREADWSITEKAKDARNADAVSQLMGHSISWAVINSLRSQELGQPIPKTALNTELRPVLENVLEIYSPAELKM
jgi:hypothetical protein